MLTREHGRIALHARDREECVERLRYIRRNPVKRGLCARPEQWPWSSFRHHITAERGPVEIESEWTALRRLGREPKPMHASAERTQLEMRQLLIG